MLDFGEEVVQFKLKDKVYELRKPNNKEVAEYSKNLKECNNSDEKESALINWLVSLGMDRYVYDLLLPSQLNLVIKSLYESEKN